MAGDEAVGREFMERITPFVYRKYLDYGAIAEIRDMKQKINKDVEQKGRTHRDVKLGYGGIREIEFVIQALQLIYAGRDRTLREKNALKALHMLSQKGLITYQEHDDLSKAYVFLRTVEHRIQILDDLQTQTLPVDEHGAAHPCPAHRIFRTRERSGGAAPRLYRAYPERYGRIYDDLFAFTGEEEDRPDQGRSGTMSACSIPETPEQEAVARSRKLGFRDPARRTGTFSCSAKARPLSTRRRGAASCSTRSSRRSSRRSFLHPIRTWRSIISSPFSRRRARGRRSSRSMRLDASAGKVLIAIFANSEYLSRMLVSRPVLLQNLLESRKSPGAGTLCEFCKGAGRSTGTGAGHYGKTGRPPPVQAPGRDPDRHGGPVVQYAAPQAVSRDLSKLAEVCLDAALALAASETGRRYNSTGSTAGLAVIGAGKLGGRELSYGSDLDILFVFTEPRAASPPAGLTVFEYFSKVAEKTISYLSTLTREGFVFRVDTRLRPTGSKGPLVQSIDAFRSYYSSQAETWERQALLRARCVAGDRVVGAVFCRAIQELIYRDADQTTLAQ